MKTGTHTSNIFVLPIDLNWKATMKRQQWTYNNDFKLCLTCFICFISEFFLKRRCARLFFPRSVETLLTCLAQLMKQQQTKQKKVNCVFHCGCKTDCMRFVLSTFLIRFAVFVQAKRRLVFSTFSIHQNRPTENLFGIFHRQHFSYYYHWNYTFYYSLFVKFNCNLL